MLSIWQKLAAVGFLLYVCFVHTSIGTTLFTVAGAEAASESVNWTIDFTYQDQCACKEESYSAFKKL